MLAHEFNALSLQEQASTIKALRALYAENRANAKLARASVAEARLLPKLKSRLLLL